MLHAAPPGSDEVDVLYRQNSDFWYLTGLSEPDAVAVFAPGAPAGHRYLLFVRPRDFGREQWTGWRTGVDGAKKDFGAEEAYPVDDFWKERRSSPATRGCSATATAATRHFASGS